MKAQGRTFMAIGVMPEPGGALEAAAMAVENPRLDVSIDGAMGVLFCMNGRPKLHWVT